jgi:putative transcriptional regulator
MTEVIETLNTQALAAHPGSLAGYLLVATPVVQDMFFTRSVIYVCVHDTQGAMGVIVNYPLQNISPQQVLGELDIPSQSAANLAINFGGPVESHRGFVLHSDDYIETHGTIVHKDGLALTGNRAVLEAVANGSGPAKTMLVLGYAGWAAGQLESELERGSWMVIPASEQIIFGTKNPENGISPWQAWGLTSAIFRWL